jgi:hypothetical protein
VTRPRRLVLAAALALAAGIVLLLGLTEAERHDPFCAGCHLPPEATFVARAESAAAVDLASLHGRPAGAGRVPCVGCHGGPGLAGRLESLEIGASDAWAWLRGDYTILGTRYLPAASVEHPVADATCAGCHEAELAEGGFERHFHQLLDEPEAPAGVGCAACHRAHELRSGDPALVPESEVAAACAECHRVMGGPSGPILGGPESPGR